MLSLHCNCRLTLQKSMAGAIFAGFSSACHAASCNCWFFWLSWSCAVLCCVVQEGEQGLTAGLTVQCALEGNCVLLQRDTLLSEALLLLDETEQSVALVVSPVLRAASHTLHCWQSASVLLPKKFCSCMVNVACSGSPAAGMKMLCCMELASGKAALGHLLWLSSSQSQAEWSALVEICMRAPGLLYRAKCCVTCETINWPVAGG